MSVRCLNRSDTKFEGISLSFQPIHRDNVASLRCLGSLRFGWIAKLRWSPGGDKLAICGGGGIAIYVDGFGGAPGIQLRQHAAPVKDIAFSPNGRLLASCSADTTIALYDLAAESARLAHVLHGHSDAVLALAFRADGETAGFRWRRPQHSDLVGGDGRACGNPGWSCGRSDVALFRTRWLISLFSRARWHGPPLGQRGAV